MATLEEWIAGRPSQRLPKIFARTFWGFVPEEGGFIGFTEKGNRTWFVENYEDGDLVAIYVAAGEHSNKKQVGQLLGFIEVERREIDKAERLAPERQRWESEQGLEARWQFALPATRAWKCVTPPPQMKDFAAETFRLPNDRQRGSRGVILSDAEARELLNLKVVPANVYGLPPVTDGEVPAEPLYLMYEPSQGFPPVPRTVTEDGPRYVYLSLFKGGPELLLPGYGKDVLQGKVLAKVGLAKNVDERMKTLNQGFPRSAQEFGFLWKAGLQSGTCYENQKAAMKVERAILTKLDRKDGLARSVGGEFFLVNWDFAEGVFRSVTDGEAGTSA